MKQAVIDIGSNTVRMLIAGCPDGSPEIYRYERCITRLAGGFDPVTGLSAAARQRTFEALCRFAGRLRQEEIPCLRAVGTAALRRAPNRQQFIDEVRQGCGLQIEVIDGDEEARLMTAGILSVVRPAPPRAVLLDIGGGSTEIVASERGRVVFQQSFPIGVVRLVEDCPTPEQRQKPIDAMVTAFVRACPWCNQLPAGDLGLIATAGTVTTLAAMHLELSRYDAAAINNHRLPADWIQQLYTRLLPLSPGERETLPGMEPGRGDLLPAGMEIILALVARLGVDQVTVADAGLLEGLFLAACSN
mgnify:CR=1 FL=1